MQALLRQTVRAFGRPRRKSAFPATGLDVLHGLFLRAVTGGFCVGLGMFWWTFVADSRVEVLPGESQLIREVTDEIPQLRKARYRRTFYLPWAGAERAAVGRGGDKHYLPLSQDVALAVGCLRSLGASPRRSEE